LSLYGFGSGILKVHFGVSGEADMVLKTKFLRWSSGLDNERGIERDEETKKELHSRARPLILYNLYIPGDPAVLWHT